jgi:hypothetical protein
MEEDEFIDRLEREFEFSPGVSREVLEPWRRYSLTVESWGRVDGVYLRECGGRNRASRWRS